MLKPIVSCVKIVSEDFVELFLEYFFVDLYTTGFGDKTHMVIAKLVTSIFGHAIPGLKLLVKFRKNFKIVKENSDQEIRLAAPEVFRNCRLLYFDTVIKTGKLVYIYLVCTVVKIMFSFIVLLRVIGVIHHMVHSFEIPETCFQDLLGM